MKTYVLNADITKFNPNTIRYSSENALVLADCAGLAYQSEAEIKEAVQLTWQFKNFEFFDGLSTQAFVAGNDAMVIVAFRGTEIAQLGDIKADAEMKLTETGVAGLPGKVHTGFKKALHEVWGSNENQDMRTCIKSFQQNKQSVWFCGHSLGAALATLAAAEYVAYGDGVINGLYTIGQPRPGDAEYAAQVDKMLGSRYFRFVNNNDIVPQLPLWGPILNYTHCGNLLYIDSNGQLDDAYSMLEQLWDHAKGVANNIGKGNLRLDALEDHHSALYIALLAKNRAVKTKWS